MFTLHLLQMARWQVWQIDVCIQLFLDSDKLLHIEKLSLAVFHLQSNFVKTDFWMEPVMVRITFLSVKVRKEVGGPETQKKHGMLLVKKLTPLEKIVTLRGMSSSLQCGGSFPFWPPNVTLAGGFYEGSLLLKNVFSVHGEIWLCCMLIFTWMD